jgi:hypothetical protein
VYGGATVSTTTQPHFSISNAPSVDGALPENWLFAKSSHLYTTNLGNNRNDREGRARGYRGTHCSETMSPSSDGMLPDNRASFSLNELQTGAADSANGSHARR